MKKTEIKGLDKSTEEKIKMAAEKVFMEKGFSAARTRDIAEESGINLALLNYYYRSKENLFNIIIMEKLGVFIDVMLDVLSDDSASFEDKIRQLVDKYSDMMMKDPKLPLFLMGEVQQNPDFFIEKLNVKSRIQRLTLDLESREKEILLVLDVLSLIYYPFIVRGVFEKLFDMDQDTFNQLLNKRKEYIPIYLTDIYSKFSK